MSHKTFDCIILTLYQLKVFKKMNLVNENHKKYIQQILSIKSNLEKIKNDYILKEDHDNLYILINESYECIPSMSVIAELTVNYLDRDDIDLPNNSDKDNYENFRDIMNTNFKYLTIYLENYINNFNCNIIDYEYLENRLNDVCILDLKKINDIVNEKFNKFHLELNEDKKKLTIYINDFLKLLNEANNIMIYDDVTKNTIYNFNVKDVSLYDFHNLKLSLYKNIIFKCKSIINLTGNIVSKHSATYHTFTQNNF